MISQNKIKKINRINVSKLVIDYINGKPVNVDEVTREQLGNFIKDLKWKK